MGFKHTDECLRKAAPDEPIFVIRAKDPIGPATVEAWCRTAERAGIHGDKIQEARKLARAMAAWRQTRVADPATGTEAAVIKATKGESS